MPRIFLEDAADRRLDDYRSVKDAELWRDRGLFVAEGRVVVRRVIEQRTLHVRSVLVNPAADRQLDDVLKMLSSEVPVYVCGSDVCSVLTGFAVHRGCLALVQRPDPLELNALLAGTRLVVVVEALADADNVGGVFRNAAAFGASLRNGDNGGLT